MDSKSEGPAATGKGNGELFGTTAAAIGAAFGNSGFGKGILSVVGGDETKVIGGELSRGPAIRPR
jgi:hypothetical protein